MPITGYTSYINYVNATILEGGYSHPPLIDKKREAPRHQVTCLGSHSWMVTKRDLNQVHPAQRLSGVVGARCG